MPTIAYIANQFPSAVEPYVGQEISELRRRGATVVPCSAQRVDRSRLDCGLQLFASETLYLPALHPRALVRAAGLCLWKLHTLNDLFQRVLLQGRESPARRLRALLHTGLGIYFAALLEGRKVQHIHVHHGYFACWTAMVAARLLGIEFSVTLHGSDLLLRAPYLDTKLKNCRFCLTVSEFNRQYIVEHYPEIPRGRVMLQRLGVHPLPLIPATIPAEQKSGCLVMLAVGRLHPVKDHAFLVHACRRLKDRGAEFLCLIAGDGPERGRLQLLIRKLGLQQYVTLLGHVSHSELESYYALANLIVLTSRSEGVPLVLMEAMARGRTVLAPRITGIPELVQHGKTGFLYRPGSLNQFIHQVETIRNSVLTLGPLRQAAHHHVLKHFNRDKNLANFVDRFLTLIHAPEEGQFHENSVLQQI